MITIHPPHESPSTASEYDAGARPELVRSLNELLGRYVEGEKVFAAAAQAMDDPDLAMMLRNGANDLGHFARECGRYIREVGGHARGHLSARGAIQQAWLRVGPRFLPHPRAITLRACDRIDDAIERAVAGVKDLPPDSDLWMMLSFQYDRVRHTHRAIRDSLRRLEAAGD